MRSKGSPLGVAPQPELRVVVARLPKMLTGMTNSPGMRLGAVAPEVIAGRLVDRLEAAGVPPGLTILRAGAAVTHPGGDDGDGEPWEA